MSTQQVRKACLTCANALLPRRPLIHAVFYVSAGMRPTDGMQQGPPAAAEAAAAAQALAQLQTLAERIQTAVLAVTAYQRNAEARAAADAAAAAGATAATAAAQQQQALAASAGVGAGVEAGAGGAATATAHAGDARQGQAHNKRVRFAKTNTETVTWETTEPTFRAYLQRNAYGMSQHAYPSEIDAALRNELRNEHSLSDLWGETAGRTPQELIGQLLDSVAQLLHTDTMPVDAVHPQEDAIQRGGRYTRHVFFRPPCFQADRTPQQVRESLWYIRRRREKPRMSHRGNNLRHVALAATGPNCPPTPCLVVSRGAVAACKYASMPTEARAYAYLTLTLTKHSKECPAFKIRAHRLILWATKGQPALFEHVAMHLCHNPSCLHPDHLAWGEQRQNLLNKDP